MIRLAVIEDLPTILNIYEYARSFMKKNGNATQWNDNFPPEDLLKKDIECGQLYVYEEENIIHGVFANKIMQHIILKNGFIKCGTIYVEDGSPRIAFEKI